jgi:hypothetical protein
VTKTTLPGAQIQKNVYVSFPCGAAICKQKIACVLFVPYMPALKDDCGFVQWRVCFYAVGELNNFVFLLDMFWDHMAEKMAKETKFGVVISTAADVDVDATWENLSYTNYTLNEPSAKLPVAIFECPPPFGKRPATFAIEILDAATVSIVITQVYNFRTPFCVLHECVALSRTLDTQHPLAIYKSHVMQRTKNFARERFDGMGVPGGRVGVTDTSRGDYVRLMKNVDVTKEAEVARIVEVLDAVMKGLALRVLVDGHTEAETAVSTFLNLLRQRPHMHFVDPPTPPPAVELPTTADD